MMVLKTKHDELTGLADGLNDPALCLAKRNGDSGVKIASNMLSMSEALLDLDSILTQEQKQTQKAKRSMTALKNGIVESFQLASQIAMENDKQIVRELDGIPEIKQNKECAVLLIELTGRHNTITTKNAEEIAEAQTNTLKKLEEKLVVLKESVSESTKHNIEIAIQNVSIASKLWAIVKNAALVSLTVVGPAAMYGLASTVLHAPETGDILYAVGSTVFKK